MSRNHALPIPNQIRRCRRQRHLRLRDVAELLSLRNGAHISSWERGLKVPSLRSALRLSAALYTPVEILFSDYFNEIRREIHKRKRQTNINCHYE